MEYGYGSYGASAPVKAPGLAGMLGPLGGMLGGLKLPTKGIFSNPYLLIIIILAILVLPKISKVGSFFKGNYVFLLLLLLFLLPGFGKK